MARDGSHIGNFGFLVSAFASSTLAITVIQPTSTCSVNTGVLLGKAAGSRWERVEDGTITQSEPEKERGREEGQELGGRGLGLEPVLQHRKTTASQTGKRESSSWKCSGHAEVHWEGGGEGGKWYGQEVVKLEASHKTQRSREFEPKI